MVTCYGSPRKLARGEWWAPRSETEARVITRGLLSHLRDSVPHSGCEKKSWGIQSRACWDPVCSLKDSSGCLGSRRAGGNQLRGICGHLGTGGPCPRQSRSGSIVLWRQTRVWLGPSDQPNRQNVLLMGNKRPCALGAETQLCVNI